MSPNARVCSQVVVFFILLIYCVLGTVSSLSNHLAHLHCGATLASNAPSSGYQMIASGALSSVTSAWAPVAEMSFATGCLMATNPPSGTPVAVSPWLLDSLTPLGINQEMITGCIVYTQGVSSLRVETAPTLLRASGLGPEGGASRVELACDSSASVCALDIADDVAWTGLVLTNTNLQVDDRLSALVDSLHALLTVPDVDFNVGSSLARNLV